jgi:hypothetical protein
MHLVLRSRILKLFTHIELPGIPYKTTFLLNFTDRDLLLQYLGKISL